METADASRLQQTLPKQNHRGDIESGLTDQLEVPLLSSQDEEHIKMQNAYYSCYYLMCGALFCAALFNTIVLPITLTKISSPLAAKILMVVADIVALVYCVKNCVAPVCRICCAQLLEKL